MKAGQWVVIFLAMVFISTFQVDILQAGGSRSLMPVFIEKQQESIGAIMNCFLKGAGPSEWSLPIRDLMTAEMGMISYGVSYLDPRMHSRLAEGLGPTDYPLFGFRVFHKRYVDNGGIQFKAHDSFF